MLGWLNKLGGIIFYVAIYTVVFSVLLFYAEQVNLVRSETIEKSISYSFVQPWGPRVINSVGSIVPLFRDMLELFFENVSKEIPVR